MAEGKNIEIKIAATGGDQAAAEVKKVETASTDLGKQQDAAAGKTAKAIQLREETLRGVLQAADAVKKYGETLKEAGPELDAVFGAENAGKLRGFGEGMETLAGAADLAARGFAVGGPLGAAIGAMVGVALPSLKEAMDDMVASLTAAAESEAAAEQSQLQLNRAYSMGVDAYLSAIDAADGYREKSDELTDSINAQITAMTKRNKLADAADDADAAEQDGLDAQKIRDGADPNDVETLRAAKDAETAKAKVARELEAKRLAQVSAADQLLQAGRNVEAVQNDPRIVPKDEREKAVEAEKKKRDAAQKAFDKSQADFELARDEAPQKIRKIDATARNTINAAAGDKAKAEKEAARKAENDRLQEARKAAAEELRAKAASNSERVAGGAGRANNKPASEALKSLGKDIGSADTQAEINAAKERIAASQALLGDSIVQAMQKMLAGQEAMLKKVQVLEGQIKNSRK